MCKQQIEDTGKNKAARLAPAGEPVSSATDPDTMPGERIERLLMKRIKDLEEDTSKQINSILATGRKKTLAT